MNQVHALEKTKKETSMYVRQVTRYLHFVSFVLYCLCIDLCLCIDKWHHYLMLTIRNNSTCSYFVKYGKFSFTHILQQIWHFFTRNLYETNELWKLLCILLWMFIAMVKPHTLKQISYLLVVRPFYKILFFFYFIILIV